MPFIEQNLTSSKLNFSKKFEIVYDCENYYVINKSNDITVKEILDKIYHSKKSYLDIIYDLPLNIAGGIIISKNKTYTSYLRNLYGSNYIELTFDIISTATTISNTSPIICTLPIAKHKSKDVSLISSTTGKKSYTEFQFIEKLGKYEHWQARCFYLREDQILLHAYESGISILGDTKYSHTPIPSFKDLNPKFKANRKENNEFPYYGPAIYLSNIKIFNQNDIQISLSKKMLVFIKFLSKS